MRKKSIAEQIIAAMRQIFKKYLSVRNGTFPALELVITLQQISIISNRKDLFEEDTFMACNFGGWIVSKLVVPN